MLVKELREAIVQYSRMLITHFLTRGTAGNISCIDRSRGIVAITPSGVSYETMQPEDIVIVDLSGAVVEGRLRPSSELNMHLSCYQAREDVNSVVHTHSPYATVMACLGKPIEPIHYLIGFAGESVPVTPYVIFGTQELGENAVKAMGEKNAVLLGNHGLLAVGKDIGTAFTVAEEIEFVAELYYKSLCVGGGQLIQKEQLRPTISKFAEYGQKA